MPDVVTPDQILKQLSGLWEALGREGKSGEGAGVLRACTMTLAVLAESGDDPAALGETLAALMPEHPARTIEVRLLGESREADKCSSNKSCIEAEADCHRSPQVIWLQCSKSL